MEKYMQLGAFLENHYRGHVTVVTGNCVILCSGGTSECFGKLEDSALSSNIKNMKYYYHRMVIESSLVSVETLEVTI